MIHEPPDVIAASICWLAHWRGIGAGLAGNAVGARHPRECAWCVYPPAELMRWIEDFNERDLIRQNGRIIGHRMAGPFTRLPRDRQRELVDQAAYGVPEGAA